MISVCTPGPDSALVNEFRKWVEAEWGEVDPFTGTGVPAPILALKDGSLVGGLSFTCSAIPGTQEMALWINTLLVDPKCRRMGIGSKLITAAERCVKPGGVTELYVFTNIAGIYEKLGWHIHGTTGNHTVLTKNLLATTTFC